jgi:hypothetical protein
VFAAFGDYIVMWDARTGGDRGQVRLPSLSEEALRLGLVFDDVTKPPWWISSTPIIHSLLLNQDRLVVFVTDYGNILSELMDHDPIIPVSVGTRVLVYNTSAVATGGSLVLLFQQDINGDFSKAQRIGSVIHLVTLSEIDHQKIFGNPLDRPNFGTVTNEKYIAQTRRLAESLLIPAYVHGLTEELSVNGQLPNIARLSLMQTEWNASGTNPPLYKLGLANMYVQISSLDLTLFMTTETGVTSMNMSGVFVPFIRTNVYSAVNTLVLATQGVDYVPDSLSLCEVTK